MNNMLWPSYSKEEINKIIKVIKSGKVNYWTGNYCKLFEKKYAKYVGVNYGVAVANGSLALLAALQSLDLKKKDEVIVTPRSFITSASSVISANATPVFVDVDLNSQNIYLESIKKNINRNTKAIICVHLAGFPSDMIDIVKLAKKNKIKIIEDCSQAHGAKINNKLMGSFGDIAIWSFCNDKIISTLGEGGMITTNNKTLWKKIWSIKDIGKNYNKVFSKNKNQGYKWLHDNISTNMRMTEVQAVSGIEQLKKLENTVKIRRKNAKKIYSIAKKSKIFRLPIIPKNYYHSYYRCYVFLEINKIKKNWNRNKIVELLRNKGFFCLSGVCPEIYNEKAFKQYKFKPNQSLINAKKLGKTSIAFDVNPNLDNKYFKNLDKYLNTLLSLAKK